jgi:folate-binding protein YgfZ
MDSLVPNAVGVVEGNGHPVPEAPSATSVGTAYAALRHGIMLMDRTARSRMTFAGAGAREVLTGLLTNDVLALARGQGQYAAALTPKGKILADVRLFAREQDLLVDTSERAAAGWTGMIRKFVNPRLARYTDVSASWHALGAFGVRARWLVSDLLRIADEDLSALVAYAHRETAYDGSPVMVARVPDGGVEGYELFAEPETARALWTAAIERGATPAHAGAFDVARIEAGRPAWGVDMDDNTLPQEANLDELHAISYTKGCYTGQETVARVHFRGHVNKHLRGIRFDSAVVPLRGAELMDEGGERVVGDVRSAAVSPRLGGVGLAMIRREVATGASLGVRLAGMEQAVTVEVVSLPFPL